MGTLSSRAGAPGSQWRQEQGGPHGPAPEPGWRRPIPQPPTACAPIPQPPSGGEEHRTSTRQRKAQEMDSRVSGQSPPLLPTLHLQVGPPPQASAPSKEAALPRRPPSPGNWAASSGAPAVSPLALGRDVCPEAPLSQKAHLRGQDRETGAGGDGRRPSWENQRWNPLLQGFRFCQNWEQQL